MRKDITTNGGGGSSGSGGTSGGNDMKYCDDAGCKTSDEQGTYCKQENPNANRVDCSQGGPKFPVCPGQLGENYCDGDGDCTDHPEWCACPEAQALCNKGLPDGSANENVLDGFKKAEEGDLDGAILL